MTAPLLLDPEIEGLLQEIAADPRSSLLKIDRPMTLTSELERDLPVSVAEAGLTNAESHLLQVNRSEVAWHLRSACFVRFFDDPQYRPWICHKQDSWNQAVHKKENSPDSKRLLEVTTSISRLAISEIASLALRFEASPKARLYQAIDLLLARQFREAATILDDTLGHPLAIVDAEPALEASGFYHSDQGEYQLALLAYKQACALAPTRLEPVMNWLLNGILARNRQEATRAADALDCMDDKENRAVTSFIHRLELQLRSTQLPFTSIDHAILGVRPSYSASRRITDVLTHSNH